MPPITEGFTNGLVSARDRRHMQEGECQTATGIYYKPGDPLRAHKVGGRTSFGDTGSAAKIKGLAFCNFDTGTGDKVVAFSGTAYYGATPGLTGTFSSLATGLSSSATTLSAAHFNDRWYLANGTDYNRVLESDGTVRRMGMMGPQEALVGTPSSTSTTVNRPGSASGFTNSGSAIDADAETFASATRSTAGSTTLTCTTWGADASGSRLLTVKWQLKGAVDDYTVEKFGTGGQIQSGFLVTVLLEKSEDTGGSWSTMYTTTRSQAMAGTTTTQIAVTANSNAVQFRITLTYTLGTSTATVRVYDVYILNGSTVANFSTTTGLIYGMTEYDSVRGLESPHSTGSKVVTLAAQNLVTLTLPTARNATSTTFRIYRTTDGGTYPNQAGLIAEIPSTSTTFVDRFDTDKDTLGDPLIPRLEIDYQGVTQFYSINTPPPAVSHLNVFKGSMVGVSGRALYYSEAGTPESWPEIYVIASAALPEKDLLRCTASVGDSLICFASEVVFRLDDLPRVVNGVFNASELSPLRGAPGIVGQYAMAAYSVAGEPRVAWVTTFGIYETNGFQTRRLTTDLEWSTELSVSSLSSSVLHWDKERQVLIFAYDSDGGGTNDRFLLLHMLPEHEKGNQTPKITKSYGAFNHVTSGLVSGTPRVYTGHVSNGIVYHEGGTSDASQSYSGTTVPLSVLSRRIYGPDRFVDYDLASIYHTDAGGSQNLTVTVTTGDDSSGITQTVTKTISAQTQKASEFMIARAGQWCQVLIEHTGAASFALGELTVQATPAGQYGNVLT